MKSNFFFYPKLVLFLLFCFLLLPLKNGCSQDWQSLGEWKNK